MTPDRLPEELVALYRADRARAEEAPAEAFKSALEAKLEGLLGGGPPTPPSGGEGSGGASGAGGAKAAAAKAVAWIVVGAVLGTAATLALRPPKIEIRTVEVERRVEVPVVIPSAPGATTGSAEASPVASAAPLATTAAPATRPSASAAAADDRSLARERVLLEGARSALARHDGAAALAVTEAHASEFPRGRLTEEREALAIQALVLAGREAEARSRAARFRTRFPNGLFLPVVEAAFGH